MYRVDFCNLLYLILVYRTQTNSPASSNILNQVPQNTNTNPYPSSTSTNTSNSINKPTISQQRSPYLQQGRVLNSNSMDSSYNPQQSYSIQQNDYGQYPIHHQQQSRFTLSFLIKKKSQKI